MPDHLGTALTASNHGDNPTGRVDGVQEVVVRMENGIAQAWAGPGRNIRHKPGPQHDVLCTDGPAVDLHGKALPIEGDLTYFRPNLNIWQAARHPLQILIELLPTDPNLRPVDKPIEPLVGAEERQKGVLTRGIDQCHEVFQVRDLEDGLRKQQAGVPLDVRAPLEETRAETRGCEECSQAEVEGACSHPDRVQHDLRAHGFLVFPRNRIPATGSRGFTDSGARAFGIASERYGAQSASRRRRDRGRAGWARDQLSPEAAGR